MTRKNEYIELANDDLATSMDRIRYSFIDPRIELTKTEEQSKHRFSVAWMLMVNARYNYTTAEVAKILREKFNVNPKSSYNYINGAYEIFGKILNVPKEGRRAALIQRAQQVYQKAMEVGNLKQAVSALDAEYRFSGLAKDEGQIDWSKVGITKIYVNLNMPSGENKTIDLANLHTEDAKVIEEYSKQAQSDHLNLDEMSDLLDD